ncbi:hypothetical protein FACS189467_2700 [Bacteroidia bacterium]|nr:hypothetical protein FACS189467_2700 [Bacteroidia bacterium]
MKKISDEEFMNLFEQGSDEVDNYIDYSTGVSEYPPSHTQVLDDVEKLIFDARDAGMSIGSITNLVIRKGIKERLTPVYA